MKNIFHHFWRLSLKQIKKFCYKVVIRNNFSFILNKCNFVFNSIPIWKERLNSYPEMFIIFSLSRLLKKDFFSLRKRDTQELLCLFQAFLFTSVLVFKILFLERDLIIISLLSFLFMKGAWFARTNRRFCSGACSLKIFTIVVWTFSFVSVNACA